MLEQLEQVGADVDLRPALAVLAGRDLRLDETEVRAALRRAMLLLAAGGDPRLGLDLDGRAVTALADELAEPRLRAELAGALARLRPQARDLPFVTVGLETVLADEELAWRAFACGLLAEELESS